MAIKKPRKQLTKAEIDKRLRMQKELGAHRAYHDVEKDQDIAEFEEMTDRHFNDSADIRVLGGSQDSPDR